MPAILQRRSYAPQVYLGDVPAAQAPIAPDPVEEEILLPMNVTLTALQRLLDVGQDIDKEGDVWVTHVWGTSTSTYNILMRFHNGRSLMSSAIQNVNFVGTVAFKTAIRPMFFPAGSRVSVDLTDTSNAGNTIQLIFGGIRRLKTLSDYK